MGSERPEYRRAPRRNEDADYVLGEVLGYGPDRVSQLAGEGAFGVVPDREGGLG